jgi:hypothetical protein
MGSRTPRGVRNFLELGNINATKNNMRAICIKSIINNERV